MIYPHHQKQGDAVKNKSMDSGFRVKVLARLNSLPLSSAKNLTG